MRKDLTQIILVADRSGSMDIMQAETEKGINDFLKDQKSQPGETNISLWQFDDEIEEVYNGNIKNCPNYSLKPRYNTALYDCVGQAMNEVGSRLSNTPEQDRPGLVVVCICTDGLNNSSHKFTAKQIKDMIKHQQDVYSWQFMFIGTNIAMQEAENMEIKTCASFAPQNADIAYRSSSNNVSRMRAQTLCNQPVSSEYTEYEIQSMK